MNNLTANNNNVSTVLFSDESEGRKAFTMANLIFNPQAMQAVNQMATMLADNSGLVPDHFNGKPGDLMGVIMQAGRWGMDPIAVAQTTFVLNGKVGYEAKLMQAVARANGGVEFTPEYIGPWDQIRGNFKKEMVQKFKKGGGTYQKEENVPKWSSEAEQHAGVKLVGTWPNGSKQEIVVMMNTCHPRNSTNWTYDPEQQIYYTAVKRWVRRFAPHLGLGIQDYDDLAARQQSEKEINPIGQSAPAQQAIEKKEPNTLDDILEAQPEPEVIHQQAHQEVQREAVEPITEPASLDDVLGDGSAAPSKFEELRDLLCEVDTMDDYNQLAPAVNEAGANKLVTEEEYNILVATCTSLFNSLQQPQ